ncbi:MAG: NAD-dependent epimerase/dehydratase family protein [Actinomycetota bacterium]
MEHVIVGSGGVGSALASILAREGQSVTILSRRGSGPEMEGVRRAPADASSLASLMGAAPRADVIYNCANPEYTDWARDWPPMSAALLRYAELTGAVLATCSNLYVYGPVDAPMTEDMALATTGAKGRVRAQMWLDAKAAHDAGRIRATEARGSDFISPSDQSRVGSERVVPRILAGRTVGLIDALDQPHTWTSPLDVARLLAVVGLDERAWGRAWHVPSNPPRSQRQAIDDLADAADVPRVKVSRLPDALLRAIGLLNPLFREFHETAYQFNRPFILDDSGARSTFGLQPTPWPDILRDVIAAYRAAPTTPR